jgi:hypothetical protein
MSERYRSRLIVGVIKKRAVPLCPHPENRLQLVRSASDANDLTLVSTAPACPDPEGVRP